MARPFKLPDLGEGIHEGEVLSVMVSVGDSVKEGDPILEIETDKAAVEIPSPFTDRVSEIRVKPGDTVKVGDVLMTFGEGEAAEPETEEKAAEPEPASQAPEEGAEEKTPEKPAEPAEPVSEKPQPARADGPVPASPATRRLAREMGVDLHDVPPTGHGGVVTADDVRAYADQGVSKPAALEAEPRKTAEPGRPITIEVPPMPDFAKWGPVERVPVRSIRRATARQMAVSWSQIPHVTSQGEIDITKLEAFRQKQKAAVEAKGGKLTLTVFALKAAVSALKAFPNFNAAFDTEAGEIILKRYYHIGVAVDTDEGLIVPTIRDVDRKSLTDLAIELNDLVQRTRQRKTSLEEMHGGTFTITNIGALGGEHFTPIINYPQVSILGMGAARMKPVVVEKREGAYDIVPRLILPIVVTIDHRVLDGADAHRFLNIIIRALEDPEVLMMTMV